MKNKVTFGDVATIKAKLVNPQAANYACLPHVSAENIVPVTGDLRNVRSALEDGVESGNYLFDAGDVLYSKLRPYLQKAALVDFDGLCSADIYPIKTDSDRLLPEYAKFLLVSADFTEFANEASARSRMPKLNREQLFGYEFYLPPLEEQRSIAVLLKSQLAAVEEARQAAQAQLDEACLLSQTILRSVFLDLADTPQVAIVRIADIQLGKMLSPNAKTGKTSFPYLRNQNVQWGRIDVVDLVEMDFSEREREKFSLRKGDLLICEGGEPGRCAVWQGTVENCYYQKALHRVRPHEGFADSEFLYLWIRHQADIGSFKDQNAKTTIAHLPLVRLEQFLVPDLSLPEQRKVAQELKVRLAAAEEVRQAAQAQLDEIKRLPGRMLAQAFDSNHPQ